MEKYPCEPSAKYHADAGPGVPEELRAKIFERFYQVQVDAAKQRTSRGLGLAFCKLAAEAHGGRILLEPAPRGSVFCVQLPAKRG